MGIPYAEEGILSGRLTRAHLLVRGAGAGAAVLAGGTMLGPLAGPASADPISAADLAYVRLLVALELLGSDFYGQAVAASVAPPTVQRYLKRAGFNEGEHYQSVAGILSGAGAVPATADDIDFTYPAGTFGSTRAILELALRIEALALGGYLGALGAIGASAFKTGLAQIAANEAEHLSTFSSAAGGKGFDLSFPPALTIDQASDALDAFTS